MVDTENTIAADGIRDFSFYKAPRSEHDTVAGFQSAALQDGIHSIYGYKYPIDFMLQLHPGRPLIVYFNGAVSRDKYKTLPVLLGAGLMGDLEASSIVISDASLHSDPGLALGWHAGSAGMPLPDILREIIDHVAQVVQAPRIIFCGPSGGGFAALACAVHYPQSLCYVWNPQTDILKYNADSVLAYGRACFGLQTFRECRQNLPALAQTSLINLYAAKYAGNTVLYTQNLSDAHVIKHATPFMQSISSKAKPSMKAAQNHLVGGGVWYFSENWGDGHVAPEGRQMRGVLRAMINNADRWPRLTRNGQIASILERVFNRT